MLVLRLGVSGHAYATQAIKIGDDIVIRLSAVRGEASASIAIEAPRHINIVRLDKDGNVMGRQPTEDAE